MNIHFYAGESITAEEARRRGFSVGSSKGTKPPRSRDNLDTKLRHNKYPGGKLLRRAQANLHRRIDGIQPGNARRPDRISARDNATPWGSYGFTKPGAMK